MKTFVQDGKIVTVAANRDALAGAGMLVGQLFGVLVNDAVDTLPCQLLVEGVVTIAKTSALAISQGDALYWDNTAFEVNKTATNQKEVGLCLVAAADPSPTVVMKLVRAVRVDNSEGV